MRRAVRRESARPGRAVVIGFMCASLAAMRKPGKTVGLPRRPFVNRISAVLETRLKTRQAPPACLPSRPPRCPPRPPTRRPAGPPHARAAGSRAPCPRPAPPAVAAWSPRPAMPRAAPCSRCGGAAGGRVFRHAAREHAGLDVGRPLPRVRRRVGRIGIDGTRVVQRQQRRIAGRIRRRAAQRNAAGQLDHQEGQADRHDLRRVLGRLDVPGARRKARATASTGARARRDSGCGACNSAPFTSALRAAARSAPVRPPLRTRTRPARTSRCRQLARQHHRRADIGMPGERHFPIGREDPHFGRVRRIARRQHEAGLGEMNSRAMRCICAVSGLARRARRPADCRHRRGG